jgi:hypothetical protein
MALPGPVEDVVAEVVGRHHRSDPVVGRTGGPAGNALLTAWTGLLLLVLFAAELVTLLDVTGLIDWHVAIGVLLIPPALVKTASTGWRILRYYAGAPPYRHAGPPPLLLRLLGPLVIAFTLALLCSGLVLLAVGPQSARQGVVVLGHPVSAVTVHAGLALCWAVVTGAHVLARLMPALSITGITRFSQSRELPHPLNVPARRARWLLLGVTMAASALACAIFVPVDPAWSVRGHHEPSSGRPADRG